MDDIYRKSKSHHHYHTIPDASVSSVIGERMLWRMVIRQAMLDLLIYSKHLKQQRFQQQAIAWFKEADEDYHTVCQLADIDPVKLRNMVMSHYITLWSTNTAQHAQTCR